MITASIILPVYNESALIESVVEKVLAFAQSHPDYEFLFVDDGSTDGTPERLRQLLQAGNQPRVTCLLCPVNGGKGRAIQQGIAATSASMVCFTDGDLAYSLDHLPLLVDALRINDVVIGSRSLVESSQRNIRLLRKFLGWGFNRLARLILHLPYRDTQAGLKGFHREPAEHIFSRLQHFDFSFDVEVVFLARRYSYRVAEVAARVSESHSYKISSVHLWKDPLRMFWALLRVRRNAFLGKYD